MEKIILDHLELALIILGSAGFILYFIVVNYRSSKRNNALVETARAVVYYKNPKMEPVLLGRHSTYIYHVTFHTETGEILTLYLNPQNYHALSEGSWGILTWQADRFWRFEKEE